MKNNFHFTIQFLVEKYVLLKEATKKEGKVRKKNFFEARKKMWPLSSRGEGVRP